MIEQDQKRKAGGMYEWTKDKQARSTSFGEGWQPSTKKEKKVAEKIDKAGILASCPDVVRRTCFLWDL